MTTRVYEGDELELFARAHRWKAYLVSEMMPFVRGRVLEVGAGIGGTTRLFAAGTYAAWTCLDPDPAHARRLAELLASSELAPATRVLGGTIDDTDATERFDAILYIDVLEHIEKDEDELRAAAERLAPGGHLIVLSPAHAWLYSPFDRSVGHFRRYSKQTLSAIAPPELRLVRAWYLDSVGMLASLANRVLLRQETPTAREIELWDRVLVRASMHVDRWLAHRLGKSVVAVWQRPE